MGGLEEVEKDFYAHFPDKVFNWHNIHNFYLPWKRGTQRKVAIPPPEGKYRCIVIDPP